MINDNTILSSFNDRPTLLEWLKKVEEALKTDTATAIKFVNTSPNHYIASIEFANGNKIESGDIAFPDTINQVSITDGELIINYVSGRTDNLGQLNAYEGVIVINSETNTTEISNNLQVNGTITAGGNVLTAVVANPTEATTGTLSSVKIGNTAYAVGGGTQWYQHVIRLKNGDFLSLISLRQDALKDGGWPNGKNLAFLVDAGGPFAPNADTSFHILNKNASTSIVIKYINGSNQVDTYTISESNISSEEVNAL